MFFTCILSFFYRIFFPAHHSSHSVIFLHVLGIIILSSSHVLYTLGIRLRRFLIGAKVIGSQRPFDTDVTFKYYIGTLYVYITRGRAYVNVKTYYFGLKTLTIYYIIHYVTLNWPNNLTGFRYCP